MEIDYTKVKRSKTGEGVWCAICAYRRFHAFSAFFKIPAYVYKIRWNG